MSYTKQTWATGDVITANKMNHMEDGIASNEGSSGGSMLIEMVFDQSAENYTSSVSYSDVVDAFKAGTPIIIHIPAKYEYSQHEVWLSIMGYKPKNLEHGASEDTWDFNTSLAGLIQGFFDSDGIFTAQLYID